MRYAVISAYLGYNFGEIIGNGRNSRDLFRRLGSERTQLTDSNVTEVSPDVMTKPAPTQNE